MSAPITPLKTRLARDGLQNEPAPIDTATKLELIEPLSATDLTYIQATSFVSSK